MACGNKIWIYTKNDEKNNIDPVKFITHKFHEHIYLKHIIRMNH